MSEPTIGPSPEGPARQSAGRDGGRPSASELVDRFGGIRPMASKLGVPVTTVQGWKERGAIPEQRWPQVAEAAARHGIALDPDSNPASAGPLEPPRAGDPEPGGDERQPAPSAADEPARRTEDSAAASEPRTAAPWGAARPAPRRRHGAILVVAGAALFLAGAAAWWQTAPWLAERLPFVRAYMPAAGGADSGALYELAGELAALGRRVEALERAPGAAGKAVDPSEIAALEGEAEELASELRRLASRVDALEQRPAPGRAGDERLAGDVQRLGARLAELEEAGGAAGTRAAAALLFAVERLRDSASRALPFAAELEAVAGLGKDDPAVAGPVAALARHAPAGVATRESLRARFDDLARALAREEAGSEGGWRGAALRWL
ncbi:MAG: carph-isopro domain-containing protein, partial [Alphaproteobacteria bacterium]